MSGQDQNTQLLTNTLALNLALQTIKERCVHLQKRLYALESENSRLRLSGMHIDKEPDSSSLSEIESLRAKNAELILHKAQLTENLTMISTENRKLWQRLSQLTKEGLEPENSRESHEPAKLPANNLIRSKTFTQNSPHQLLKEKLAGQHVGPEEVDISLDCGFTAERMNFGQQQEEEPCDTEDGKICTEGMMNIKKELMKQNSDLKVALSNWRKLKARELCSCKTNPTKKPQMVDKSLGTDRDTTAEISAAETDAPNNNFEISTKHDNVLIDLINQKKAAYSAEKVCPMCGKFYSQDVIFEAFQEHVESHFRDDTDSLEQTPHSVMDFELVSHSVGNF